MNSDAPQQDMVKMQETKTEKEVARRRRSQRPFPSAPFEDSEIFAKQIYEFGAGRPARRLSLFDHLRKSPESSASRQLITNANKYGLVIGSYSKEQLELTKDCLRLVDDSLGDDERLTLRANLAIQSIDAFNHLYTKFVGNKLPAKPALHDAAREFGIADDIISECIDLFIVNLRFVGLLRELSGAERILAVEHAVENLPQKALTTNFSEKVQISAESSPSRTLITAERADFEKTCFYITPIGDEGTEVRKHSDLFLSSIIEPALEEFELKVLRADKIDKPGTITRQIIEYILKARLVIADLSFHNPNVFYELAIRHCAKLPVVQIVRAMDRVPFDLNQSRTIIIDNTDIYTLVPKIEIYRAEIASQVRTALKDPDSVDNPVTTFCPSFRVSIDQNMAANN